MQVTNSVQTKNTEGVIRMLQVAGQNFKKSQIILDKTNKVLYGQSQSYNSV